MIVILGIFLVILVVYVPQIWIKYVFRKYSKPIEDLDGTGGELAEHLVDRFELEGVKVIQGLANEDYYNPAEKIISLSPDNYSGKSLTAVAVAAHEVGHAIQFCKKEPVSFLRERYMGKLSKIQRIGNILMIATIAATVIIKIPHLFIIAAGIGIMTMLASLSMYIAILPEEFDASFNKALPILDEGYIDKQDIPAIKTILRAAALTYVAAALTNVINLWRWIRFLK
ncbi:MAG: zinc metallopeptidase [Arenicella sp.]